MLLGILAISLVFWGGDPLGSALASFDRLDTYTVTLRSSSGEVIDYFYKKPGYIRMEFEEPHKGAVLVYDPLKKEVKLRPFGSFKSFGMTLSPEDRLIRSSRGHTVDESDIGTLLKTAKRLQDNGSFRVTGEETVNSRKTAVLEIRGNGSYETDGINLYRLWLEETTMLPLKAQAFDSNGKLVEEVLMDDLKVNTNLSPDLFQAK